MEFKQGTTVKTRDGNKVGTVDQIVIDPATNHVTHIVVEKGFLFTEDRVLPVETLTAADDDAVLLNHTVDDVDDFPLFEETYFIKPDAEDYRVAQGEFAPLFYYPPVGAEAYTRYPSMVQPAVQETVRNIPDEGVVIHEGTRVLTTDGEFAGDVERLFADNEGHLTHILISKGFLFPAVRLVPMNWVRWMGEGEIQLAVPTSTIKCLPAYHD